MPFKSEAQRRYLWANEPEIARDWTDTYGSRVQKNTGGIMDVASDGELIDRFKNYKKGKQVTVPTSFQARAHSTPVNLAYITDEEAGILKSLKPDVPHDGPMHIPNYDDYDPDRGAYGTSTSGAQMSGMETGSTGKNEQGRRDAASLGMTQKDVQDIRSGAIAAGAGQNVNPGWFGPRNRVSKEELARAKAFDPRAYRATRGSGFNPLSMMLGLINPALGLAVRGFQNIGPAFQNFKKHKTLADWWGSRSKNKVDYDDMSKYNTLSLYDKRINPDHYNDLGNEFALSTEAVPENIKALANYTTGINQIHPEITNSYTSASDLAPEFQHLATHAKAVGPALTQMRALEKKKAYEEYGGATFTNEDQQKLDRLKQMDADPNKTYGLPI